MAQPHPRVSLVWGPASAGHDARNAAGVPHERQSGEDPASGLDGLKRRSPLVLNSDSRSQGL